MHENGAGETVLDKQQQWEAPSVCAVTLHVDYSSTRDLILPNRAAA
ncbi:hypothetical protein [Paenibacillus sp. 1-18]|nr:hypothetical protein [Paenibacillus sp. 1-18]